MQSDSRHVTICDHSKAKHALSEAEGSPCGDSKPTEVGFALMCCDFNRSNYFSNTLLVTSLDGRCFTLGLYPPR